MPRATFCRGWCKRFGCFFKQWTVLCQYLSDEMLWFSSFKLLVQTSNGRFVRCKRKNSAVSKSSGGDSSGGQNWEWLCCPVCACHWCPRRASKQEKPWSEETSVPSVCVPQPAGCKPCQWLVRALLWPGDPQLFMDSTEGMCSAGTGCSISGLLLFAPWLKNNIFGAPFSVPLFPLLLQPRAEPLWPWEPVGKWTLPNSFWLPLSSRRGKEIPFL